MRHTELQELSEKSSHSVPRLWVVYSCHAVYDTHLFVVSYYEAVDGPSYKRGFLRWRSNAIAPLSKHVQPKNLRVVLWLFLLKYV